MFESAPKKEQVEIAKEFPEIASPVPEYNRETSKEGFSKWLKSIGFAAALSLINPAEASTTEQEKHELSPEQEKIVGEVLGAELVDKYRANGFEINVPLEADEHGEYVVHIGQTHEDPEEGLRASMTTGQVREFQDTLGETLKATADKGSGVVFAEGVGFAKETLEEMRLGILTLKENLEECSSEGVSSVEAATRCAKLIETYSKNRTHSLVRNSIPRETVQLVAEKTKSFLQSYVPHSKKEAADVEFVKIALEFAELDKTFDVLAGTEDFMNATYALYMNEEIVLAASEDVELNQKTKAALVELRKEERAFISARREAFATDPELLALKGEFQPLFEKFKAKTHTSEEEEHLRAIHTSMERRRDEIETELGQEVQILEERFSQLQKERELVVFDKIEEYEQAHGAVPHAIVVYGADHDFSEELAEYNRDNDPKAADRGLIEIKQP